jgi:hypothetical protein
VDHQHHHCHGLTKPVQAKDHWKKSSGSHGRNDPPGETGIIVKFSLHGRDATEMRVTTAFKRFGGPAQAKSKVQALKLEVRFLDISWIVG